ncbi:MAG: hypothetical protein KA712_17265 [Myxococcales bacterium]|nr:hypothetical protein [Myxococcales bacterium]
MTKPVPPPDPFRPPSADVPAASEWATFKWALGASSEDERKALEARADASPMVRHQLDEQRRVAEDDRHLPLVRELVARVAAEAATAPRHRPPAAAKTRLALRAFSWFLPVAATASLLLVLRTRDTPTGPADQARIKGTGNDQAPTQAPPAIWVAVKPAGSRRQEAPSPPETLSHVAAGDVLKFVVAADPRRGWQVDVAARETGRWDTLFSGLVQGATWLPLDLEVTPGTPVELRLTVCDAAAKPASCRTQDVSIPLRP